MKTKTKPTTKQANESIVLGNSGHLSIVGKCKWSTLQWPNHPGSHFASFALSCLVCNLNTPVVTLLMCFLDLSAIFLSLLVWQTASAQGEDYRPKTGTLTSCESTVFYQVLFKLSSPRSDRQSPKRKSTNSQPFNHLDAVCWVVVYFFAYFKLKFLNEKQFELQSTWSQVQSSFWKSVNGDKVHLIQLIGKWLCFKLILIILLSLFDYFI